MRTWEETIQFIRTLPQYKELVQKAYFDENLHVNVDRFGKSEEFKETLRLLKKNAPQAQSILDIGSGNGISAINFALQGYAVTVSEPDPSNTIGAGAIEKLKGNYKLDNISIYQNYAEEIGLSPDSFDIVYARQAMHHAYDLNKFIRNLATILKKGGILLTIRDHVIFDQQDKEWFLQQHPLHQYYGGENAFTSTEYRNAFKQAGLEIIKELKYYDSAINYFPLSQEQIIELKREKEKSMKISFRKKVGWLANLPGLFSIYKLKNKPALKLNEKDVAGRMYSYILQKQ